MAYRDDIVAAEARAVSAEREAARLRERRATLGVPVLRAQIAEKQEFLASMTRHACALREAAAPSRRGRVTLVFILSVVAACLGPLLVAALNCP